MTQSEAVTSILERITQEAAQVSTKKKVFGMKSRRTASSKSARPLNMTVSSSSSSSLEKTSSNDTMKMNDNLIDDTQFFDDQWSIIDQCIECIFGASSHGQFEPAFQAVERLCRQKCYQKINEKLLIKISEFSKLVVSSKLNPPVTLSSVNAIWDFIQQSIALLSSIFSTFERSFLNPQTIEHIVYKHVNECLHQDNTVIEGICSAIIKSIDEQRNSIIISNEENISQFLLQKASDLIIRFDIVKSMLSPLEVESAMFYSKLELNDDTVQHFLIHAKDIIQKEEKILSFFALDIQKVALSAARENVYAKRFRGNLTSFISQLVDMKDYAGLHLLSTMVSSVSSDELNKQFVDSFSSDTKKRCENALALQNNMMIPELLQIHNFLHDCKSSIGMKEVFRTFKNSINIESFKIAFLLAKYCHNCILNTPEEFIPIMDKILNLFREFESMDAFIEHHRQFLAVRLLRSQKTPSNIETQFYQKIGIICGEDEVTPIKEMIADVDTWQTINTEYAAASKIVSPYPIVFQTLNSNQWPHYKNVQLRIPIEILDARAEFTKYYCERYSRKKLEWLPVLDQVKFKLNGAFVTSSVIYYLIIESVINGTVLTDTGINDRNIQVTLQTLISQRVLKKDKTTGEYSVITKLKKIINLPTPKMISPKQMKDKTVDEVFVQRAMKIEAALVLTMKRMKTATENDLYEQMFKAITFHVSKEDFDKCLKNLIDKSYFIRNEEGLIVFTTD